MQNDGIEKTIFEWWDNIPYELKIQKGNQNLTIKLWKYILNILIFGIN